MNLLSRVGTAKTELIIFFALWLVYGLAINSGNLTEFSLQYQGTKTIVERRQFNLEVWEPPNMALRSDYFTFNGRKYANKQPGQFMLGALVYFFLYIAGLTYVKNYLLTSGLVTFFTCSLLTAAGGVAVFRLAKAMDPQHSTAWATFAALTFGLATTAFPYSGIAHHDAMASALLIMAFYLIFSLSRNNAAQEFRRSKLILAGFFLALTITTSLLTLFMVFVIGVYFLSFRRWKEIPYFAVGAIAGLAPLLFYDAVSFGNPFFVPLAGYRAAGQETGFVLRLDWDNFIDKTNGYAKLITLYVPVFWLGLWGLFLLPREYRREKYVALISIGILAAYVVNIPSFGGRLYGPRYLLPAMPFVSFGLVGLRQLPLKSWAYPAVLGLAIVFLFSFLVNLAGALQGAMFCGVEQYCFPHYVSAISRGEIKSFPLVKPLLPAALTAVLVGALLFKVKPGERSRL